MEAEGPARVISSQIADDGSIEDRRPPLRMPKMTNRLLQDFRIPVLQNPDESLELQLHLDLSNGSGTIKVGIPTLI